MVKQGTPINNLSERELIKVWQHRLLGSTRLVTEEGEPIEIIYPGRPNDDQGADFRDAVLATSKGLIRGDIEVHVKSSDWRGHQHHQNIVYNRVVLHVVMWHNSKTATHLQNGRDIPVLALNKYITSVSPWTNSGYSPTTDTSCLDITRYP
ncbi:MAG: DUF2851 family protein, partial [Dehalococcoidales bacterium]|nr:DUF2851 family protein [Dehalococcoidales bacterium]